MKVHGVKCIGSRPLFMKWGKHYCPACSETLKKVKVSKIVNSGSDEAKDFDFSGSDGYMTGNVKFIWTEFFCAKCGKNYAINDIYNAEKSAKRQAHDLAIFNLKIAPQWMHES